MPFAVYMRPYDHDYFPYCIKTSIIVQVMNNVDEEVVYSDTLDKRIPYMELRYNEDDEITELDRVLVRTRFTTNNSLVP